MTETQRKLAEQAQMLTRAVKLNEETGAMLPTHVRDVKATIKRLQRQLMALELEG